MLYGEMIELLARLLNVRKLENLLAEKLFSTSEIVSLGFFAIADRRQRDWQQSIANGNFYRIRPFIAKPYQTCNLIINDVFD